MRLSRISAVSAFARPEEHLTRRTLHGGIVTMMGVLLATTLFVSEVSWYLGSNARSNMEVDLRRHRDLSIYVDVTFHAVPCAALSVDIIDASGTADSDVNYAAGAHLHKVRLGRDGAPAGEYATPQSQRAVHEGGSTVVNVDLGAAMQHMGEMEEEIGAAEGCRLRGDVTVRRVAGRLHFAVHQQSFIDKLPQMLTGHVLPHIRNMSHTVHSLSFGPPFPGRVNPLDGTTRVEDATSTGHAYKYYIKIVPTEYKTRMGAVLETNQYSVSEYSLPLLPDGAMGHGKHDPFVNLIYDLSPIVMRIQQSPLGLFHFLVRLCAVVGGALSVTRLADNLTHTLLAALGVREAARRSSAGGGYVSARGSVGGGSCDGMLPTAARVSAAGGRGSHSGSLREGLLAGLAGAGGSLLRHSSGGFGSTFGSGGGGGGLPVHGSAGGGAPRLVGSGGSGIMMSSLSGFAPPALNGFGSWSALDGEGQHKKG